ncbi:phage protein [Vibrio metschnikovii]|nr:phage protein [Vibrio metschnikovii]EKO3703061.1 phage protein [Vibrio metschnikovii]EKO3775238.1 phage protein [Vibrio metschnikovii]
MKYHEMSKNYIFRELQCQLSIKETAELCFKSVRTVKQWDSGKMIPPECKRLMRMHAGYELNKSEQWNGFKLVNNELVLPTGQALSAQQVLMGAALVEISASDDIRTRSRLLKYARVIAKLMK